MRAITVSDVLSATGGRLLWGDTESSITGVHYDSREIGEGDLFVPIIGAKVDAHKFIPDVLEAGAACVLSSEADITGDKGACIYVDDTVDALQELAAWYRQRFDVPVVGVTGSVGKTSTKEMIGAVLERKYKTLITYKNLNSQIGLPIMIFNIDDDTEMVVLEMGISMPGEMDRLVNMASPETAVITNIGVSHIGNLGSRENICEQKGRIITNFGDDGRLFACANSDQYELIKTNLPYDVCKGECKVSYYGLESEFKGELSQLTYYASDIEALDDGQKFIYHYPEGEYEVHLSVMGEHNITNAVVALSVGLSYGVDIADAADAVSSYKPLSMRGEVREYQGIHIVDDTYNASPDSIRSNLRALFSYKGDSRHIAVLGDVLELGDKSEELHKSIGAYIESEASKGRRLDGLYCIGNESKAIVRYIEEKTDIPVRGCSDSFELIQALKNDLKQGDRVLFKASRGMHLDEVVQALIGQ